MEKNKCSLFNIILQFILFSFMLLNINALKLKEKENEKLNLENKNPGQTQQNSGGGDNGEFLRRHQPQEHLLIPLINQIEGDYNPFFNTDIKKYREEYTKLDKNIKFLAKLDKERKSDEMKTYYYKIKLDEGIDPDINKIFKAIGT